VLHPDRLVEPDRGAVLSPHEEADGGRPPEQQAAEVAQPARAVPLPSRRRIDPHLLELHRRGRPRGSLRLEQDRPVLEPEPGAPLLDLAARAPAEAFAVAAQGIDADLLLVRRRARGHEQLEVVEGGRAEAGVPGRGSIPDDEHRLSRTVLARPRQPRANGAPEVRHGVRLADQHPRGRARDLAGKRAAPRARRHRVDTHVAEGLEPAARRDRDEAPDAAPRHVLQEDPLDRILGAETHDLLQLRLSEFPAHAENSRRGIAVAVRHVLPNQNP
jgi:hypothetical protein